MNKKITEVQEWIVGERHIAGSGYRICGCQFQYSVAYWKGNHWTMQVAFRYVQVYRGVFYDRGCQKLSIDLARLLQYIVFCKGPKLSYHINLE